MGKEAIRQAIVTKIEALRSGYTDAAITGPLIVEYDNNLIVDTQKQSEPWMCVNIKFISAEQMELSDNPHHRFMGQIEIAGVQKEGSGSAAANRITDYFYPRLHRTAFGPVRTYMADTGPMHPHVGWCYYPMLIPFWSDQNG